jgi:hypothetical protein
LNGLVDLNVILKSKKGDGISTYEIFCHYGKYIDNECKKTLRNVGIEQISGLKEDCKQHIFMRLIKTIERFDPNYQK